MGRPAEGGEGDFGNTCFEGGGAEREERGEVGKSESDRDREKAATLPPSHLPPFFLSSFYFFYLLFFFINHVYFN